MRIKLFFFSIATALLCYSCCNGNRAENHSFMFVDKVYSLLDSENSRWFYFSSACRPFGMVNLSPDNEIDGDWGSGYRYKIDTIKGFSHIHAWQMSGLSVMPVNLSSTDRVGMVSADRTDSSPADEASMSLPNRMSVYDDFSSKYSHESETVKPGYHALTLDRYGVKVELTSTKRVGFHRYTFPVAAHPAILFNLNKQIGPCLNRDSQLEKKGARTLTGSLVNSPTRRKPKDLEIYFRVDFDCDIKDIEHDPVSGNYLVIFDLPPGQSLLMKAAISYTSHENAALNMSAELAHWDFEQVMNESFDEWNRMLGRIEIEGGSEQQQRRFYTDLWHALQGRRVVSDVNGAYPDHTGSAFRIGQIPCDGAGKPLFNHYNSDSYWGAQWTITTLWQLVYPEIAEEFVHSMMMMYRDGGLLPRGPAAGNYTFVMTGASTTPFIVGAVQKGIVQDNLEEIYRACRKNHMPGGIMEKAGYEHNTSVGGGLKYYIELGYVPYPLPDRSNGFHMQGAGMTLEYAYQDWTLAQFAKRLGHMDDYTYFMKRSENYKNVFDPETGWMRPKDIDGKWLDPFDPLAYAVGFVEANSAQATWFVPHDLPGLAQLMGGAEKARDLLDYQFSIAERLKFTSGTSHDQETHPTYKRIPINYGNQPSTQTAHVFTMLGYPYRTQYWTRKLVDAAFSGLDPSTGYNGDEDQGMMGSLGVLLKIGLFQMTGGTEEQAFYQIGVPQFDKVTIHLNNRYHTGKTFVIKTQNNLGTNIYIQNARFNRKQWNSCQIPHSDLTGGGILELELGDSPTSKWGQ